MVTKISDYSQRLLIESKVKLFFFFLHLLTCNFYYYYYYYYLFMDHVNECRRTLVKNPIKENFDGKRKKKF